LGLFFGTDAIPFSLSWDGLPGVTRSFDSFSTAAQEAGQSRIWAGIHWAFDVSAGEAQGTAVASYIFQNFLQPRTSPPGGGSAALVGAMPRGFVLGEQPASLTVSAFSPSESRLPPDGTALELPVRQAIMIPVSTDTTGNTAASDSHTAEAALDRFHQAHSRSRVDNVFASAEVWLAVMPV
jgi:hypothetical protein